MKKHFLMAVIFIAATAAHLTAQTNDALKTRTKSNQANEKASGTENTPIKLTTPATGKEFTADEAKKPITFRWTPVVPKPQQPVTYRLKVWQLMQGQNATQAMRTNKPIVTKDVDNVTETTADGIYTGPCKPPYLCDFIWAVEVVGANGKTATETFTFSIKSAEKNDY
jgi:hypothetical protein